MPDSSVGRSAWWRRVWIAAQNHPQHLGLVARRLATLVRRDGPAEREIDDGFPDDVMAKAGQALAIQWGHEPWSDSWARLVARAMLDAQRCPVCGKHLAGDHYECVVGEPRHA